MSEVRSEAVDGLLRQFLAWVGERERSYGEVMDAWRTSCPRLTVWEDAVAEGLVKVEEGKAMREAKVKLTEKGKGVTSE
jgi:hypothetical protein